MRLAVLTVLFLLGGVNLLHASEFTLTPYVSVEHFRWEEKDADGRRILKESGPLGLAGLRLDERSEYLHLQQKGEFFGGIVGYTGETQQGVPITLDVDYLGTDLSLRGGPRLATAVGELEPFASIGYRYWSRNLHDTMTAAGKRVSGYTERWQNLYTKLGLRWSGSPGPGGRLFFEGGGKNPFYVTNTVNFTDVGDVTFRPGGNWSPFGAAGWEWGRWQLSILYEGFSFSRSPTVTIQTSTGPITYLQPDSTSDIWALQFGLRF